MEADNTSKSLHLSGTTVPKAKDSMTVMKGSKRHSIQPVPRGKHPAEERYIRLESLALWVKIHYNRLVGGGCIWQRSRVKET